jgi:UDP-glucose 4-epimerase
MTTSQHFFGKTLLVTGASGFIGTHLCRELQVQGAIVHGISRHPPTDPLNAMRWWQADLEDIASVRSVMGQVKPDIVYHLASNVTGSRAIEYVLPTLQSNLVSTVNLLITSNEMACQRIILAGSLEEPDDDRGLPPTSPYAAAKGAGSQYARMFYDLYQTPVVTARIFMVYGPGQNARFLIPYVISTLLAGEAPKLSSGKRPVDWIYVDDLVAGLLAMAHAPQIAGQTIDLGSGALTTVRAVVDRLVNCVDARIVPAFGAMPDRSQERVRVANTVEAYQKLNWKAGTSLEEGLRITVDWYKSG